MFSTCGRANGPTPNRNDVNRISADMVHLQDVGNDKTARGIHIFRNRRQGICYIREEGRGGKERGKVKKRGTIGEDAKLNLEL